MSGPTQAKLAIDRSPQEIVHGFKIEVKYTRNAAGQENIEVSTTGGTLIEWTGSLHQAIRTLTDKRSVGGKP